MDKLSILHKLFALAVTILCAISQATLIQIQHIRDELHPELRVKNEVVKKAKDENPKVVVRLRDNKILEGYIRQISDSTFTIMNPETGEEIAITYETVEEIVKSEA